MRLVADATVADAEALTGLFLGLAAVLSSLATLVGIVLTHQKVSATKKDTTQVIETVNEINEIAQNGAGAH